MASAYTNPTTQNRAGSDWGRLIPGIEAEVHSELRNIRKPPRSVRPATHTTLNPELTEAPALRRRAGFDLILPAPLNDRSAWQWLRATTTDFALIGLNWLAIGAAMVPLRAAFPRVGLFEYAAGAPISLLGIAVLHAALVTLVGYSERLYQPGQEITTQSRILGKTILLATLLLCIAYGLQGAAWATNVLFCAAGVLHMGTLFAWRWHRARQRGRTAASAQDTRNVLIVGAGAIGRRMASHLAAHPEIGRTVSGFLDNERPLGEGVLGRVSDLALIARNYFVDEVILAILRDRTLAEQVLHEARRLRLDVEIVPELFGCLPASVEVERMGDLPVICLHSERLPALGLVLKRLVDIAGSVAALVVLSPLMAAISLLIKMDSPGPVFYSALRAGRKARLFRCWKYRTMVKNADALKDVLRQQNERSGPFFKITADPRITTLGRFLRRYSLDELPQLWNVLKGDMSLVGPRPHPLDDFDGYEIEHLARLDVLPGITGLWQVTARRDPSFQRGMELDREYIRTWNVVRDMRILLQTVAAVVRGSGD